MADVASPPSALRPAEAVAAGALTHVLRYDDFSATSCTRVEEEIAGVLAEHRLPCTVAAIPFACDAEALLSRGAVQLRELPRSKVGIIRDLLDAGLAEVALHGYSHLALSPLRDQQEFAEGIPKETQRALIRAGREHLEQVFGCPVHLFVPPWNRLSGATAEVLAEEGMWLSAMVPAPFQAETAALPQVPCLAGIAETLPALRAARRLRGRGSLVGTLFHDYDFEETGYRSAAWTVSRFRAACASWAHEAGVGRALVTTAIAAGAEPATARMRANAELRERLVKSRLGWRLFRNAHLVYWDTGTARRLAAWARRLP